MDNIYILILIALTALAVFDLIVGVSNDAVNFLNSAIGSKAIPYRTIMIIASLGIFLGAVSSSGMMEVARKGIFNPAEFYFNEIMFIFIAVMITDILLLDFFNTIGLPTSTTVSIVFELLGAAVCMAIIKISMNDSQSLADLGNYINSTKALQIIMGILLSVFIAFTIGAIVQFISRMIYSFHYEKNMKYINPIFTGIALTAITYFIFIKGLKGTSYYKDLKVILENQEVLMFFISFIIWTFIGFIVTKFTKFNILKFIIGVGTFSLALAFAGNDLVNFIGVPMAALNSYEAWQASGVAANEFNMGVLAQKVPTQNFLLLIAGGIMVLTLWFSKKARSVAETEINLSRQNEGAERFEANYISRITVRSISSTGSLVNKLLPTFVSNFISTRFKKPEIALPLDKSLELPAFDLIRASVNLVVAGILISIATSYKLPLSTTYVTFMVAMGTSLADKAWGLDSAVYRVAGLYNVIGGWFFTAFAAFMVSGIFLYLIYLGGIVSIALLLILVVSLIIYNSLNFYKKKKEQEAILILNKSTIKNINSVLNDSSQHVANILKNARKLFSNIINDLGNYDLEKSKKNKKYVERLDKEVKSLNNEVFYYIKSMEDSSIEASKFYILILNYIQDVSQSITFISTASYDHINNNHKKLKKKQISDLQNTEKEVTLMLKDFQKVFETGNYAAIQAIINEKTNLFEFLEEKIEVQIKRVRSEDESPKGTILYFGLLLETKDLIDAILNILNLFSKYNNSLNKKN